MTQNELTIEDILEDDSKNFLKVFDTSSDSDDDEDNDRNTLCDSNYHTPTDFRDMITAKNINNDENLTIISINIANIMTKLDHFKIFIKDLNTKRNKIDIIALTETHLTETKINTYTKGELENLLEGYVFICKGRKSKNGGGVGVFISEDIEDEVVGQDDGIFVEEVFESIVLKIKHKIDNHTTKDITLIYLLLSMN